MLKNLFRKRDEFVGTDVPGARSLPGSGKESRKADILGALACGRTV